MAGAGAVPVTWPEGEPRPFALPVGARAMTNYRGLAEEIVADVLRNGAKLGTESVLAHLDAAYGDALADAAKRLETMHFLLTIQCPGTGPFTRQDITVREVVEQGAAAIRALKP